MPYPRIHITNVRGHGIPPCPLCVFPPGDACSPTECTLRRVWHPCHTHATLCQSSHGIHRIHRNFWRRRASHGFRRCPQMVRLRRVLWEDSLVVAWVWQDAIPSYNCTDWGAKILRVLCNLWENISARKICEHLCHLWEDISAKGFCEFCEFCGRMQYCLVGAVETTAPPGRVRGYGRDAIPSYNCTDWGAKILRVLCNLWENISARNICEHL